MQLFYIAIIALLVVSVAGNIFQKKNSTKSASDESEPSVSKKDGPLPYSKREFMNSSEKAMYDALKSFTDSKGYIIFAKVRLEDLVNVNVKEYKELQRYRGYIKSRHVDFVVCDNKKNVVMAIEVDGKSHNSKNAQDNDQFKNRVFETIGIPLHRIVVGTNYAEQLEKIFWEIE